MRVRRYWSGSEGSRGALFEDAEFPATWRSVGDKRRAAGVQWLRPHVSFTLSLTNHLPTHRLPGSNFYKLVVLSFVVVTYRYFMLVY